MERDREWSAAAMPLLKKQLGGLYVPISFDKLPVKQERVGEREERGEVVEGQFFPPTSKFQLPSSQSFHRFGPGFNRLLLQSLLPRDVPGWIQNKGVLQGWFVSLGQFALDAFSILVPPDISQDLITNLSTHKCPDLASIWLTD